MSSNLSYTYYNVQVCYNIPSYLDYIWSLLYTTRGTERKTLPARHRLVYYLPTYTHSREGRNVVLQINLDWTLKIIRIEHRISDFIIYLKIRINSYYLTLYYCSTHFSKKRTLPDIYIYIYIYQTNYILNWY